MSRPQLSVVVPTLNEAEHLPLLLADLRQQQGLNLEIVVADGGSSDDTVALARAAGVATVATAARGRARQMNAGAAASTAATLLFLHADSRLEVPSLLRQAIAAHAAARTDGGCVAGHFAVRFTDGSPQNAGLYAWLAGKSRSNRPYSINGDQGLLITRSDFEALGGYRAELSVLEDQDFAARIRRHGRWLLLPGALLTSARRFEVEGAAARYQLMAVMMGLWSAGCDAFFARAPQVYAQQSRAQRLDLKPFVKLVAVLLREQGLGAAVTLYRVGRFVQENTWQLFHYLDWRGGNEGRWLRRYDHWIEPLIAHPLGNAVAAIITVIWFFVWLPLTLRRA